MNNYSHCSTTGWFESNLVGDYKTFFMRNSAVHDILNAEVAKINENFRFKSTKPVLYPANVKMQTIVGILIFMSRINFMLS